MFLCDVPGCLKTGWLHRFLRLYCYSSISFVSVKGILLKTETGKSAVAFQPRVYVLCIATLICYFECLGSCSPQNQHVIRTVTHSFNNRLLRVCGIARLRSTLLKRKHSSGEHISSVCRVQERTVQRVSLKVIEHLKPLVPQFRLLFCAFLVVVLKSLNLKIFVSRLHDIKTALL